MASFNLNSITDALTESKSAGVDFSGKSLKLDNAENAKEIVEAINNCKNLYNFVLTGNTLGVGAAQAIAKALEKHPEFKVAKWSDMFTGRMKTEIPPALSALGDGMITAGARLTVLDLSDNAFGPIGVQGLATLLKSEVCSQLQELRLNNNGLGITGGKLLASALSERPPQLRVFVAGRNRLENDGAKALAEVFVKMGTLEEVAMPQNGIYHAGIAALSTSLVNNPRLHTLNLNDNTIGSKGAEAIAGALHTLRNIKNINFGDCLLKSKGARALAKSFRDNAVKLETLDLSHNEIGHEACLEIVECITVLPDSGDRLTRVVLAGNSLGSPANRTSLKEKLGECADLSDGENSDDEYVTGSEESEESEDGSDDSSEDGSEDSATEDARHDTVVSTGQALDESGVEEVDSEVGRFLRTPTVDQLARLGSDAATLIDVHLQVIKSPADMIQSYADAIMKVSSLSADVESNAQYIASKLYPILILRAGKQHAAEWLLANSMLVALGLIKSENKNYSVTWPLAGCYQVLSTQITAPYFPQRLRETLRFFIQSKREKLVSSSVPATFVDGCV